MALTMGGGITIGGNITVQLEFPPGAPTIGTATATSATTATVAFTAPSNGGSTPITSYTATSSPGGVTGTLSQAGSGTITVSGLSSSTSYTFTVTATNSNGTSIPSSASNSITTPSTTTPPVNTVAPVVSGTASFGSTLSTTNGTWTGTATITFTYQWQRNGSNISSATSSTYTLVAADVGNPIRCVVTGTNAVGNSSANSNATANISAIAPDAPTIGAATTTGLTTATVAFTAPASDGGATITTYTATSSPGGITGTLSQAGSGTINVTGLTSGTSYTFTVTATNSAGTGSASAASNSITTFTIPVNTVAPVVSGTASFGSTLSTTNGTWTGTATITFTYQWQRNNVNIGSATASTYTLVLADVGNPIRCVVTGTNSYGNSSANSNATSNISAIAPGAPTIGTATVTGSTTATVSFTAPASDGGATITTYTATSSPGGITGTLNQAGSGTITVSGLSASTSYTFTVTATTSAGTSAASAASNSITTPLAGNIWTWGNNTNNWLSVGLGGNQSNPVQLVSNANNWAAISAGGRQSTGIKTDGTYWAWGGNSYGQLGDDTNISKTSPVQTVAGGTNWSIPAAGSNASGGIKTDGTLWTWGKNFFGVLGNDSAVVQVSSPVQTVAGGTNWSYLTIPNQTAAALKTDGTLWSWGRATSGALGDLSSISKSSPVQTVAGGTNWRQVTVGGFFFTLAIKTDGTLWSWGNGANGTLGNNSTSDVSSPIQTVASGTNWQQVSAGYKSVAAIKTDGTLWTWGLNSYGQLGDNTIIQRNSPVQTVSGGTVWSVVSAGNTGMTASIKTDGTLWTWGRNNSGQLGDGTIIQRNSPVQTSRGGTDWKRISVGPADTTVGLKMIAIVG